MPDNEALARFLSQGRKAMANRDPEAVPEKIGYRGKLPPEMTPNPDDMKDVDSSAAGAAEGGG